MNIEQNEELTRMIAEQESNIAARNDRISCMNLVPSTQACDVEYVVPTTSCYDKE